SDLDPGAHALKLGNMHKAVLKDRFAQHGSTIALRHEGHELSLHVRWKSWVRSGRHIDGSDLALTHNSDSLPFAVNFKPRFAEFDDHWLKIFKRGPLKQYISTSRAHCDHEGASFNAICNDRMIKGQKLIFTLNVHDGRPRPIHASAHLVQNPSQLFDLGLSGAVDKGAPPLCQGTGHHEVFRAGDGGHIKHHLGSLQSRSVCLDVTMLDANLRAQCFQSF